MFRIKLKGSVEKGDKSNLITFDTGNWKRSSNYKTHSMYRYLCVKKHDFKCSHLNNCLLHRNFGQCASMIACK